MKRFLVALFAVGQCIRLLQADPWVEPTMKIYEVGTNSYFGESAYQSLPTWKFIQTHSIPFSRQEKYRVVPCPKINWDK